MSYLVLARKARPQTFQEVVGQKPVVRTLQNSLKRQRVAHAILFSGVRGVGKTTLARLMAKALNCENGPAAEPCNTCLSCKHITSGSSLDLHEIDGASNRGIQEVRELKEKIKYLPTSSPYKIVIIDEVHMLTTEAFNALLKTLEEPPEHVYFMFATTELHKIPITILSRCQRYELQRVSSQELAQHFSRLATAEGIELDKGALTLIVREAEGSVRDGLSLLDQVFSYGQSPIKTADVVEVLGLVNREVLLAITRSLLTGDRRSALENFAEICRFGMDIKRFMADLLECFRSLLLVKIAGCDKLLDLSAEELAIYNEIAADYTIETIHQKLNLLMRAAEDIRYSLQPQLALETSFLAVIEAGNVTSVESLLVHLDSVLQTLPAQPQTQPSDAPPAAAEPAKKKIAESAPAAPAAAAGHPAETAPVIPATPPAAVPPPPDALEHQVSPPPADTPLDEPDPLKNERMDNTPPAVRQDLPEPAKRDIRKDWLDFISYVKERREWMSQNLQQADSIKQQGQELLIEYSNPAECILLRAPDNRRTLTEYVLDFFQKEYTIHFITPNDSDDPGMDVSEGPKKQRQKLAAHSLVRMTEEIFGGHVGNIRIGPLSR